MASLFPINVPKLPLLKFSDLALLNALCYLDDPTRAISWRLKERGMDSAPYLVRRWDDRGQGLIVVSLGPELPLLVLISGVITPAHVLDTVLGQVFSYKGLNGLSPYWSHLAEVIRYRVARLTGVPAAQRDVFWVGHSGGAAAATVCHMLHGEDTDYKLSSCACWGCPCLVNDRATAAKGLPNYWRFVCVGDAVPGLPTPGLAGLASLAGFLAGKHINPREYFQLAGGIALDNGTYYTGLVNSWGNEDERVTMANAWFLAIAQNRPTSHDIRAYLARLLDAERETVVAEAHGVVIPRPAADPEQNFILPFALRPFQPQTYSIPAHLIKAKEGKMIVIPHSDKAQAIDLGGEFWVIWMGLQLVRCPSLSKAKTTAKKWNLLLYHIGVRGGVVAVDTLKQAWQLFLDQAVVDPAFKPQWVNAS